MAAQIYPYLPLGIRLNWTEPGLQADWPIFSLEIFSLSIHAQSTHNPQLFPQLCRDYVIADSIAESAL